MFCYADKSAGFQEKNGADKTTFLPKPMIGQSGKKEL